MESDVLELKYGVVYYIRDVEDKEYGSMQVKLVGPPPELYNPIITYVEYIENNNKYSSSKFKYTCGKDAPELKVGGKYKINGNIYELENRFIDRYNTNKYIYKVKLISSDVLSSPSLDKNVGLNEIIQKLKEELNI